MADRETGTVKWFNDQKGFGFIKPDDGGDDLFAHVSGITDGSMLAEGSTVSYVKQYDDRRGKERAEEITGGCEEPEWDPEAGSGGVTGPPPAGMLQGTAKFWNQKGFGFIQREDGGEDVFVHISAVEQAGLTGLAEGQPLGFTLVDRGGKVSATDLVIDGEPMPRGTEVQDPPVGEPSDEVRRVGGRLVALLERCPPKTTARAALGLVLALIIAETLMAFEAPLLLLYTVPVGLAAWAGSSRTAYALAFLAVALPIPLLVLAGHLMDWVVVWGAFSNFVLLGIIVMLITTLKRRLADEVSFVANDTLTGLPNRGSFMARLDAELARASRYGRAFTLAYVDLDNFKAVNDLEGHDVGDELLR